ncbi:hypothetical protein CF327_g7433 [Tilletia walkeri]|nr:hypothetical protein CF327_g7433 [Tilletia walkeri]
MKRSSPNRLSRLKSQLPTLVPNNSAPGTSPTGHGALLTEAPPLLRALRRPIRRPNAVVPMKTVIGASPMTIPKKATYSIPPVGLERRRVIPARKARLGVAAVASLPDTG